MSALAEAVETSTDIIKHVEANPTLVLIDSEKFEVFYAEILREVEAFVADTSTPSGRKAIGSLAYKVARTKTAIDDAGKRLNEEARQRINKVDESRRHVRARLDALRDQVRQPLTEWEEAEKARIEALKRGLAEIEVAAIVDPDDTVQTISARLETLGTLRVDAETYQEFHTDAARLRNSAVEILTANLRRIRQEEADRAELERLRAEAAERDRKEQERIAAEQEREQRRDYARRLIEHCKQCALGMIDGTPYPYVILFRELEEKLVVDDACGDLAGEVEAARQEALASLREAQRRDAERHEAERAAAEARLAEEAAARAQREAEERHTAELRRIEEERAAERRKAEREAAEKAEAERREREAAEARQRDREHRSKVMAASTEAVMEAGTISEAKAKLIVAAIAAGSVPNVTIRF
ncbi:hypothetical protein L0F51_00065 [Afifella sp. H1R]|uniref:hypothetical protein n=1 Tax=Afifella sp. H1R TaxID=2908841 RepID=UPI001F46F827|nr:hypothetical protein [Afifella sp. H1R]MCF1502160.1 hypothetical protein [Afifella sp. H1R]